MLLELCVVKRRVVNDLRSYNAGGSRQLTYGLTSRQYREYGMSYAVQSVARVIACCVTVKLQVLGCPLPDLCLPTPQLTAKGSQWRKRQIRLFRHWEPHHLSAHHAREPNGCCYPRYVRLRYEARADAIVASSAA